MSNELYMSDPIEVDQNGNSLTLMDIMSQDEDIVAMLDLKDQSARLHRYIRVALTDREQEIIRLRYGLDNRPPLTQREVACKLDISRSYVSRLEKKALEKLKTELTQPQKG